ncbi:MAG: 2-oxo acid dehydrogenase subunit E2 [Lachnospiraceae bacterium]|jgi:hypothetical protein|nr:2-oxo acid dehydrogenase subunit E2 [Lachnospiraceae bacterium]
MIKNMYKRRLGDRSDGWRVRNVDAVFAVVPYIMRTRLDSQCFFEEELDLETLEGFIKKYRDEIPGLSLMQIMMAAIVRLISQRPHVNRFVVYNKIYAHNDIKIAVMIKRSLDDQGEETPIMPLFSPFDTLPDVVRKLNTEIEANRKTEQKNDSDKISRFFGYLPPFLVRIGIGLIRLLDNIGILPKAIMKASPWHTSAFFTNIGSIGLESIYHHLYEFGTTSFFMSMGKKHKTPLVNEKGEASAKRTIGLKYVIDERICDGFYYAKSMRLLRSYLNNPEVLLTPPKSIVIDEGIGRKLWHDPNEKANPTQ